MATKTNRQRNEQRQREAEKRKQKQLSNPQPAPKQVIKPVPETPEPILPQDSQKTEFSEQPETTWKRLDRWVESPLVLSGGAAMLLGGIGLLISNAPKLSAIALFVGWILFGWSIFKHNFYEEKTHKEQIIRKSIISFLLVLVFFVFWFALLPSPEKFLGYLVPANEPTPISNCGEMPPSSVKVLLGDSEGYTNNNTMNLISAFDEPLLTAKKVGNRLQISLELFNREGASIAKVKDGVFVGQVSENLEIMSRDPHGIDIFDKTNNSLVFHIRYLNPQAIEILGEFYAKKGKIPLLIKENGVALPNGMYYHQMCFENLRGYAMGF